MKPQLRWSKEEGIIRVNEEVNTDLGGIFHLPHTEILKSEWKTEQQIFGSLKATKEETRKATTW